MTRCVRFTFAALCSALAAGGSAVAADLPVKAPPPLQPRMPAPVYSSWTGWYIGGNVGYGWGNVSTDIAGSATSISDFGGGTLFTNPPVAFADSGSQRFQGIVGGGQIGYNFQINPRWVLGFETDIQASDQRANTAFTDPFSGTLCFEFNTLTGVCVATAPLNGVAVTSEESKIGWFGTVRGRLGYVLNDGLLLYGTGGLAYGQVSVSGNINVSAASTLFGMPLVDFGPTASTFSQSKTNIGFAVGAGVEGRLAAWGLPNWTWKLEYLFVDLGSLDTSTRFSAASTEPQAFTDLTGTLTIHTHFTDNLVRVGLNYHFN